MSPTRSNPLHRLRVLPALLAILALVAGAVAHRAQAAGLLIADGGFGGRLEIVNHDVSVIINNGIAVTTVDQTFRNTENRVVEALYTFPVPRGASVSNFSMWINGKEMTGEVLEKKRARQIYESYKQTRVDPGLLEQVDYRTFEMRIFPIGPGAEQRVRITYCQELDFDAAEATYVYPLATNTRNDADTQVHGRFSMRLDVRSEIPITDLRSPSHPKDFAFVTHSEEYREGSLELSSGDASANLARDVVLSFDIKRPRTGIDLVANKPDGEDGYLLLTLTAGEELAPTNESMDYVFVLDISGSMRHDRKLELSRGALETFIDALGENDRFEILVFNNGLGTLFSTLEPATAEAKVRANEHLATQAARGGTVLRPAFSAAYRYAEISGADRRLNVVVLSDGLTDQESTAELMQLIAQRPAGVRVFCVGVGNDVNRPLLEQIAGSSGGLAAFMSPQDNLARQAAAFKRKLMRPAATDVRLSFDGGGVYDIEPVELQDLYYGMPVRLYARYRTPGEATVIVQANVDGRPLRQEVFIDLPAGGDDNPQIERMWAWKKIDRLLKQADRTGGRDQQVIGEIVRLGEAYSIVSEYTSFIVLENDAEYRRWKIERRNAVRASRDEAAQRALRLELEQLRDRSAMAIGPVPAASAAPAQQVAERREGAPRVTRQVEISPPRQSPSRPFPGTGGGGGAIDPLTLAGALAAIGAMFGAAVARRRQ